MPSQVRVDSITNLEGNGPVELPYGASLPSGSIVNIQGNVNIVGVVTVGFLTATNVSSAGVVTATSFIGDGSGLTGLPVADASKSIALAIIGS